MKVEIDFSSRIFRTILQYLLCFSADGRRDYALCNFLFVGNKTHIRSWTH